MATNICSAMLWSKAIIAESVPAQAKGNGKRLGACWNAWRLDALRKKRVKHCMSAIQFAFQAVKALVMSCRCGIFHSMAAWLYHSDSLLITSHLAVRNQYDSFISCIQGRLRRSVISFSHLVEQKSPAPLCEKHNWDPPKKLVSVTVHHIQSL